MPYIGHSPTQAGSYIEVDDFGSSFNGNDVAFTLQVGGVNITPNQQNLLVMIDGVLQQPTDAFSVSGSTITFTEAPASGADLYCLLMGQSASVGQGTIGADELKISGNGTSGQLLKSDGDGTYSYLNQTSVTAGTATTLATARTINGVSFDGSANITVTADANTLSNTTLKSTVVNSSLTSVGTLTSLNTTGAVTATGSDYMLKAVNTSTTDGHASRVSAETGASQGKIEIDFFNDSSRSGGGYGLIQVGKSSNAPQLGILASGGVGIGTTSPGENLHIKSNASAATTLKIEATASGQRADLALYGNYTASDADFAEILFVNNGDSTGAIQAGRDGAPDAGNIKFTTQASGGGMTEKIRITSEGRVIQKNTSLANSCFDIVNGSSSGYGLYIKAGNGSNYSLSVNDYNANNLLSITSGASGTATFAGKIDFSGKPNIGNRVHSASISSGSSSSYNMNGAGGNCSGGFIVGACKRDGSITADNSVCIYAHVHTQGANVYSAIIERNDDSDVTISHNGSGQLTCTNNGNSTVNFVVKYIILTGLDGSNNLV